MSLRWLLRPSDPVRYHIVFSARRSLANEPVDAAEAAVPVAWVLCGALTYTAWDRMTERNAGENVEKMLIV